MSQKGSNILLNSHLMRARQISKYKKRAFSYGKKDQMTQKAKFTTAEELETLANEYFKNYPYIDDCKELIDKQTAVDNLMNGILPTISGLCYYIGLNSINEWNTLKNKQKYKRICDKIILRLSRYWESASATGKGQTGVSNWLNAFGNFPQNQGLNDSNKLSCQIVVIGTDGNKQALSDIINATQAQRIQGTRTIDTTAQAIDRPSPKKALAKPAKTTRNPKPRKAKPEAK